MGSSVGCSISQGSRLQSVCSLSCRATFCASSRALPSGTGRAGNCVGWRCSGERRSLRRGPQAGARATSPPHHRRHRWGAPASRSGTTSNAPCRAGRDWVDSDAPSSIRRRRAAPVAAPPRCNADSARAVAGARAHTRAAGAHTALRSLPSAAVYDGEDVCVYTCRTLLPVIVLV